MERKSGRESAATGRCFLDLIAIGASGRDTVKVWFITGASKGFGRVWAEAALDRGDKVAATARNPDALAGLRDKYGDKALTLALDVTDRAATFAAKLPAYDPVREANIARRKANTKPGVPEATGPVILKLVDMEEPPLRIFFGATANKMAHAEYEKKLAEWDRYDELSVEAHGFL